MSIIVLLLWLYLCGQILFLGIVFTSVWYQHWWKARRFIQLFNREKDPPAEEEA